jgi:MYXO-CTERM domain-containing protein
MMTTDGVKVRWRTAATLAAAVAMFGSAPARAQGTATQDSAVTTTTTTQQGEEHHGFPWGLLGLLGLAGLLGRRREGPVHVEPRREELHVRAPVRDDDVSLRGDAGGRPLTGTEQVRVRPTDPTGPGNPGGPTNL